MHLQGVCKNIYAIDPILKRFYILKVRIVLKNVKKDLFPSPKIIYMYI